MLLAICTAAGIVNRQTAIGAVRPLNANGQGNLGVRFLERFSIQADSPILDMDDLLVLDAVGNMAFEDSRFTSAALRSHPYKGSGKNEMGGWLFPLSSCSSSRTSCHSPLYCTIRQSIYHHY